MVAGEISKILSEILYGEEWRQIQLNLFQATGVVLAVHDAEGECIAFCAYEPPICRFIQAAPQGRKTCQDCRAKVCRDIAKKPRILIKQCHSKLHFFAAPLVVDDTLEGILMGRAVFGGLEEKEEFIKHAVGLRLDEAKARVEAKKTPAWDTGQLKALAGLMASQVKAVVQGDIHQRHIEERLREVTALSKASEFFSEITDLERLLDLVLDWALKIMPADGGSLMLREPDSGNLTIRATHGISAKVGKTTPKGKGIAGWVAENAKPLLLTGDVKDPRFKPLASRPSIHSAISAPLIAGNRVVGVINVNNTRLKPAFTEDDLKVLRLFAQRASLALENARLYQLSKERVMELTHLNELSKVLGSTLDIAEIVNLVSEVFQKSVAFDVGGLVVLDDGEAQISYVVTGEVSSVELKSLRQSVTRMLKEFSKSKPIPKIVEEEVILGASFVKEKSRRKKKFESLLSFPLTVGSGCIGAMFATSFKPEAFTVDNLRTISTLAGQVAVSLDNARLYQSLRDSYAKTIAALSATIDAKDHYTRGHSDRVMEYAVAIGEELGLSDDDLESLRFAGLLHDIGKVGVSEHILLKPAKLTDAEFEAVRAHSSIGANIIEQIDFLNKLTPVVLHHHERYNGKGYPDGLAGKEIPFLARILAVADAFEAMTSKRAYRGALTPEQAIGELRRCSGTQFDPAVVEAFLAILEEHYGKRRVEKAIREAEKRARPTPRSHGAA